MEIVAFEGASSAPAPVPAYRLRSTVAGAAGDLDDHSARRYRGNGLLGDAGSYREEFRRTRGRRAVCRAAFPCSGAGTISGMPTAAGTQNAAVTIQDSTGTTASASLPVAIGSSSRYLARPAVTYNLLHFGNAGFGGDDTNVFQTALTYTAGNAAALEIPAGSYNISPVSFPANSYLIVDANVTVTANPGYGTNDHMLNVNAENITIVGAGAATSVFHMLKAQYTSGEWRHCLDIENASERDHQRDLLQRLRRRRHIHAQQHQRDREDCIFNNNRRHGSSITGA